MITTPARSGHRRARPLGALVLLALSFACTDHPSPVSVTPGGQGQLAVAPRFVVLGADQALPINRVRITVRDKATNAVIGTFDDDVDPNAAEWQLSVDVTLPSDGAVTGVVMIELVHRNPDGSETVEWSGITEVAITPAQTQDVTGVPIYRGPPQNLTITRVRVRGPIPELMEGATVRMNADVQGGGANPIIFWSSLDPGIATADVTGLIQALTPGIARIVAVAGPRADTIELPVRARLTGVQMAPDSAVLDALEAEFSFEAHGVDARGSTIGTAALVWSSSNPAIAESMGNGRFRARANGRVTIVAAAQSDPAIRATATLVVAQRIVSASITPASARLSAIGARQQFTVEAHDPGGHPVASQHFTWSSSDPAVATVDASGLATAVGPGTTTIRAAAPASLPAGASGQAADSVVATATLSVQPGVASITIDPASHTFRALGDTLRFHATAADSGGTAVPAATFTWSSSNPGVVIVDQHGLATAQGVGSADIRASIGGVTRTVNVSVAQTVTRVDVSPAIDSIHGLGGTAQYNAVARDRNNFEVSGRAVSWRSADSAIARVSPTGEATAQGPGTVAIAAEVDGITGFATLVVLAAPSLVDSVEVTPAVDTLDSGQTVQLHARALDAAGNTLTVHAPFSWSDFNSPVAVVDNNGLVHALNPGTTLIQAQTEGVSGFAVIVVRPASLARVVISPDSAALSSLGSSVRFFAQVFDAGGNHLPHAAVTWRSLTPGIASVDITGQAVALAAGVAPIEASSGAFADTAFLRITRVPSTVVVTPASHTLTAIGDSIRLHADVYEGSGALIPDAIVIWTALDSAFASVDSTGLVTARSAGVARIEALSGSVADTAFIAIEVAIASVVVTNPGSDSLASGDTRQLTATAFDSHGTPIPGMTFVWTTSDGSNATVDADGLVTGLLVGTVDICADAVGQTDCVTLTIIPGAPAAITILAGDAQLAPAGTALRDSLVVRVVDGHGNPVNRARIHWLVQTGGGSVSPDSTVTNAAGEARTEWTLGGVGPQSVDARAIDTGLNAVEFAATATGTTGVTITWIGGDPAGGDRWHIAANWSPARVPEPTDTVFIPAAAAIMPVLSHSDTIGGLIVENGASIDTWGYVFTITGDVDAGNTIIGVGTVVLTGTNVAVRGTFPDLIIEGTAIATGPITTTRNLIITESIVGGIPVPGDLLASGQPITVHGHFQAGGGTLTLHNSADFVDVDGDIYFYNADHEGRLTEGTIRARGHFFIQCYTGKDFVSTGTKVVLTGDSAQTVYSDCSGPDASRFQDLEINKSAGTVTMLVNTTAYVMGRLDVMTPTEINGVGGFDVVGDFTSVAGSTYTAQYLFLHGAAGTTLVDGDFSPIDLVMLGPGPQMLKSGLDYINVDIGPASQTSINGNILVTGAFNNYGVFTVNVGQVFDVVGALTLKDGSTTNNNGTIKTELATYVKEPAATLNGNAPIQR